MKTIILLVVLALGLATSHFDSEKEKFIFGKFEEFVKEHSKKYSTIQEFFARYEIFKKNFLKLENFQLDPKITYKTKLNKFADLTLQEFRRTYLNLDVTLLDTLKSKYATEAVIDKTIKAPASFDYRTKGSVGRVKDQGGCGSCWAFSAVANLEGVYHIKHRQLLNLSEQQLVDCSTNDQGCNGGFMDTAFQYIIDNGGIQTSQSYPYTGYDGQCYADPSQAVVQVTGFQFAGTEDEQQIKQFLVQNGPLSVALNADLLMNYYGGILTADSWECDPEGLNHGVAIVGYGNEFGQEYWIVRNSWGESWGENGYFRIALGTGVCGINKYAVTAQVQ
jgi:C1A family cysteine protease